MAKVQCGMCRGAIPEWDVLEHKGKTVCRTCYDLSAGPLPADGDGGGGTGAVPRPGQIPRPTGTRGIPKPGGGGIPRPGGGTRAYGAPGGSGGSGGSGFNLAHGPGDLLVPMILTLTLLTLLGGILTGSAGGVQGMFCLISVMIVVAAIEGALLVTAARIFKVPSFEFNDAFTAAGAGLYANVLLMIDHGMLGLGLGGWALFFLVKQLVDIAAVGRFCGLDWPKSMAVWGTWFGFRIVFWVLAAFAFVRLLMG